MFVKPPPPQRVTLLQKLVHAYRLLRPRGFLLDGPAHATATRSIETTMPPQSHAERPPTESLVVFTTRLQQLLVATDESLRRQLEDEVLKLSVPLRAAGIFEVLSVSDPALATMISDHLIETV